MSDPRCKCPIAISMTGDGCRYCQPQDHIDRMGEWLDEEREEIDRLQAENEALRHGMRQVNENAKKHEREMYLAKDEVEALRVALEDMINQVERDTAMGLSTVTSGCVETALDVLERQSEGGNKT